MRILSEENKILWINSIGMRRPSLSSSDFSRIIRKVKGWFKGASKVNENLYHFTPIVLPFPSSKIAGRINRVLLKLSIAYYRKKLSMGAVQLWTFLPNITEIIGELDETLLLYYCVDEWSKFSFMDGAALRDKEICLMQQADLVIVTADFLYNDKIQFNRQTHLLTHGVDFDFFAKSLTEESKKPAELENLTGPIIGFFGLIHEWIDLDLICYIARERPDWNIVLIGKASVNMEELEKYDNIILTGQKPYAELPSYCRFFDIGLIPFKINELTVNVNPIKMREYLAAGLPVVATPLPEIKKYEDRISIGEDGQQCIAMIEQEMTTDSAEKRVERSQSMKNETWKGKVEILSSLIEDIEGKK